MSDLFETHVANLARSREWPPIPPNRYFTIGEVSELCQVKPHVLRYWEQEFPDIKPIKRRGNRRFYQAHEVILFRAIRGLLYEHGLTIGQTREKLESLHGIQIPDALRKLAELAEVGSAQSLYETMCRDGAAEWLRVALPACCEFITELSRLAQQQADADEGQQAR